VPWPIVSRVRLHDRPYHDQQALYLLIRKPSKTIGRHGVVLLTKIKKTNSGLPADVRVPIGKQAFATGGLFL
jgi:hypothetical protein